MKCIDPLPDCLDDRLIGEISEHANIPCHDEARVEELIYDAIAMLEHDTNRLFVQRAVVETFEYSEVAERDLHLTRWPVTELTLFEKGAGCGEFEAVDIPASEKWEFDNKCKLPRIRRCCGSSQCDCKTEFRVTYVAGYPCFVEWPQLARMAIRSLVAHLYNVREAYSENKLVPSPAGYERIVQRLKRRRFQVQS